MRSDKINRLFVALFMLAISFCCTAQGWERAYGLAKTEHATDVLQTADGGYVLVGVTNSTSNDSSAILLKRTDSDGQEEWSYNLQNTAGQQSAKSIAQDALGNFIIGGTSTLNNNSKGVLILSDIFGNPIWQYSTVTDSVQIREAIPVDDGGYVMVGNHQKNYIINGEDQMDKDVFLGKVDSDGNMLWEKTFAGEKYDDCFGVVELPNGDFLLAGATTSFGDYKILLIKVDSVGDEIWIKKIETTGKILAYDIIASEIDDTYWLTGVENDSTGTEDDIFLLNLNENGINESWVHINLEGWQAGHALDMLSDGNLVITGEHQTDQDTDKEMLLAKMDGNTTDFIKLFGGSSTDYGMSVLVDQVGGFTVAGTTFSYGNGQSDAYLVRTDATGISLSNTITGRVEVSFGECDPEQSGQGAPQQIIQAVGEETYYTVTDESGDYSIAVPEGEYEVSLIALSPYWEICQGVQTVILEDVFDVASVNYTIIPQIDCPAMRTDIAVNHLRPGFQSTYKVTYCNEGTQTAQQSFMEVNLDAYLTIDSTSVAPIAGNGNTLTFSLGNVPIFTCQTLTIYATLDSTAVLGQTHCVDSYVTPDTLCLPIDPDWDESSVTINATCHYDSIKFDLINEGWGDMDEPLNFIVIEDQIIGYTGSYQLPSGGDTTITIATNGATFRMEAEQSAGHPGDSQPKVAVEGCGGEPFSTGYVIEFPQNDGNPFVEIDCRENTGSYDPNDKQAFPQGYSEEHFIEPNTDIDYLIRFQNEGTDTAFRVIIRDTLSAHLNEFSVLPGASSHDYEWRLYGQNILEFTFHNILLPPKEIDEEGSMGFVKFEIKQQEDVPLGTEIWNSAGIYFDYNAPIITEPIYHLIGRDFVEIDIALNDDEEAVTTEKGIKVYPNPFVDNTIFELQNIENQEVTFSLFDLNNRLVRQENFSGDRFEFERNHLNTGLYIFRMEMDGELLGSGKIALR